VHAGLDATLRSVAAIGWEGLARICGLQLFALALCGLAWWAVTHNASLRACLLSRWIRDGATNLVGFIPAVGEGISARALTVFGPSTAGDAAAATIVDVAIEALAQAIYTLVAFLLLLPHLDGAQAARWGMIVGLGTIPILLMFAISRHRGALHLGQKVGMQLAKIMGIEGGHFHLADAVHAIYSRGPRIAASFVLHLAGWGLGAAQIWIAARGLSEPLGIADSIALAGLVSAARSAFFLVPWSAGVQEGGFLLVGAAVGLDPAAAIALSLVLRARDVVIGAPAILIWYLAEGRRSLKAALR
jgi:putative membrane protein